MLTSVQIKELIKDPVSSDDLDAGIKNQDQHKLHITGDGYSDKLRQLDGFESEADYDARVQLTEPATIRLSAIILDNLNRWATNQGTVKTIKWKQIDQEKLFKEVLDQVWRGNSLEDFIQTFYKEAIYQEMEGFLLITKPQIIDDRTIMREGVQQSWDGKPLNPYIIFIAAEDVHDFNAVGDDLEYLIIDYGQNENDEEIYRVIDNVQDIIVVDTEKGITVLTEEGKSKHELGYVPAIQISNISKHLKNDKVKTSPIDHVMSDLNRYMKKDSDLIIQMVRHMYPKLISVVTDCKQCNGEGKILNDTNTMVKCPDCNGTGKVIPVGRDGIMGIPQYLGEGHTAYPGSPASYITPDNDSLKTAIDDLKQLGLDILYSATGDKNLIVEGLETATENLINFKGLEDRIAEIISMVERTEEFIIKTVALYHIDFKLGFEGVSVRYGRRLTIRGEGEIVKEITAAKTAGMPISHILALQKELIYTKYKNNPVELNRQITLCDLEPLNGYTVEEVIKLVSYTDPLTIRFKINFNDLIKRFEIKNGPIEAYEPDQKNRVDAINTKLLEDEILLIPEQPGDDGDKVLQAPEED